MSEFIALAVYSMILGFDVKSAWSADSAVGKIIMLGLSGMMIYMIHRTARSAYQTWLHKQRADILVQYGEPVPSNHGSTINEVMRNICNEDVEYSAFFTADGVKICESTIHHPRMTFVHPADYRRIQQHRDVIMVHNHPGTPPIAFSPEDLSNLSWEICNCLIVVTPTIGFFMRSPVDKPHTKREILHLARHAYHGRSAFEASVHSCATVAKQFGWDFGLVIPTLVPKDDDSNQSSS